MSQAPGEATPRGGFWARPCVWMAVVALLLRVALIFWLRSYEFLAGWEHFAFGMETGSIARALAAGEGFSSPFGHHTGPTAWVAPVYPALCAAAFSLFGPFSRLAAFAMFFMNSIFAALTCFPIVRIGERTVGRSVGLWAGWAWAVVLFFMTWPVTWVWEVSLSALLLSTLFLLALELGPRSTRKHWLGFGALWGLAAVTNPALLSFLPFALAAPAYRLWKERRSFLGPVAVALLACAALMAPWMARNRLVFGQFVFVRSNFWFEFHLGNYHLSNGLGWGGKHPAVNPAEFEKYQRLGELGYVAAARREALEFLRQYPGEFVLLSLKRSLWFWDGTPLLYTSYWVHAGFWRPWSFLSFSVLALLGLLLALGRKLNGVILFALLLFSYPAVYYLTYPSTRYRHAIEPELLLLAVYFLHETAVYCGERLRATKLPPASVQES